MHFKIMNFSIKNEGNYWIVVSTEFKIQNWCALVHMPFVKASLMMNNVYMHAAILNIFYFSTGLSSSPVNHCKQIDFMEQIM